MEQNWKKAIIANVHTVAISQTVWTWSKWLFNYCSFSFIKNLRRHGFIDNSKLQVPVYWKTKNCYIWPSCFFKSLYDVHLETYLLNLWWQYSDSYFNFVYSDIHFFIKNYTKSTSNFEVYLLFINCWTIIKKYRMQISNYKWSIHQFKYLMHFGS